MITEIHTKFDYSSDAPHIRDRVRVYFYYLDNVTNIFEGYNISVRALGSRDRLERKSAMGSGIKISSPKEEDGRARGGHIFQRET